MSRFEPLAKIAHKSLFLLKRHSPEILTGVGVIGVVASGVMLVRSGMKTPDILTEHREVIQDLKEFEISPDYSEEDLKKDIVHRYVKTGTDLVKLYSIPVLTGVVGVSCIVGGHGQLRKRNFAYAAAYKALEETFQNAMGNVSDRYGEEVAEDIRNGVRIEEYETEKGEIKTRKVRGIGGASAYARVFDGSNPNWQGDPDYNVMWLSSHEQWANDRLQIRGYLTLNDVYKALGFDETKAGQVVGWLRDTKTGDGHVSFGHKDWENITNHIDGDDFEGHILLDFNVDGPIIDALPEI